MHWEAISIVIDTIGLIAVIGSLFYLSNQIRQSAVATKTGAILNAVGNFDTHLLPIQTDAELARIALEGLKKDPLEAPLMAPTDRVRFHFWIGATVQHFMVIDTLHKLGAFDETTFLKWRAYTAQFIATEGGSAWWAQCKTMWPDDIVRQLDAAAMQVTPIDKAYAYFRS